MRIGSLGGNSCASQLQKKEGHSTVSWRIATKSPHRRSSAANDRATQASSLLSANAFIGNCRSRISCFPGRQVLRRTGSRPHELISVPPPAVGIFDGRFGPPRDSAVGHRLAKSGEFVIGEGQSAEEEVLEVFVGGKQRQAGEGDVCLRKLQRFEARYLKDNGNCLVVDAFGFPEFEVAQVWHADQRR